MAKIARWFLDITLDSETLRWWSGTGDVTLGGETYTGLGTRFITPESLSRKASLKSEKIELEFDSSRQSDNADQIGYLLDQKWRNRAVRLRRLVWTAGQTADAGDVLADERGRIRDLTDSLRLDKPAIITMELESGALAYLERRRETRSSASQKAVYAGDAGFDLIATLEGRTLAWRTKHKKEGTVQYELNEEYEPQPREWVLGRFAKTGSFVAAWTNQQQNKSLVRVYAIADHRINKLDKVWINGELMISGVLAHGVRTQINALNSGGARAWITFYDGRPDQAADSFQVAAAGPWTSAHRLRGVAYVIMEHRWDSDLPNAYDYRFGGEGALLYDRRLDTTAGGSGAQRWNDPATWAYSTNAMVAIDHYRSGVRVNSGASALWFGVGEALDAVPYAEFEALADHCDEAVALKGGGTQKRYEVNGVISAEQSHDKNLQALADQMAARAIDQGGRIAVRPPIIRASVVTLTDADLIRGSESTVKPGGKIDDMVNTLSGRFINPANDYKRDDYPAVQIAAYVDDDNGEISDTLNLDLESSSERAQRIAKLRIEDSRRILELTETYGTKAKAIEPGEWFIRQSTIRGFPAGKIFVADEVTRYIDGSMEVVATEVDPDQLVWDEETAVDLSVPPIFPQLALPSIDPPVIAASPVELGSGATLTPGIRLDVSLPTDLSEVIADQTQMEYGVHDGAGGISGQSLFLGFDPTWSVLVFGGFLPSTTYAIRFRGVEFRGDGGRRYGEWSSFQTLTTTANATASSAGVVLWSGVTGTGKPADNADVTAANTAAGIFGQGWGATAGQDQVDNNRIGTGKNRLYNTTFRTLPLNAYWRATPQSGSASIAATAEDQLRMLRVDFSGLTPGQWVQIDSTNQRNLFPVVEGDAIEISGAVAGINVSTVTVRATWRDRDGTYVGVSNAAVDVSLAGRTGTGGLGSFVAQVGGVVEAPEGAQVMQLDFLVYVTASSGTVRIARPFAADAVSLDAVLSPWSEGFEAVGGADVTGQNAAAAIVGQGALAVLNALSNGGPYLTGFGGLSGLGFITLNTSYIRRADGSTQVTETLVITSAGTAAAIFGQGSQATSNMTYGPTAPGSPQNGDWWADTTAGELKFRSAGVWNVISNIATGGGPTFSASITGVLVGSAAPGNTATISLGVSVSGSPGSLGYLWQLRSGGAGVSSNNDGTFSTITYNKTISASEDTSVKGDLRLIKLSTGETITVPFILNFNDINN